MIDFKHPGNALEPLRRVKRAMATPTSTGLIPHYRFPVNDQERYGVIAPMTPTIEMLRQRVIAITGVEYNHSVVLLYRNGDDCIGYHKDKTLDLDDTSPIVSISLGSAREYQIRDAIMNPSRAQQLPLPHGTLLSLGPKTNNEWYHSIIPSSISKCDSKQSSSAPFSSSSSSSHDGIRISITFRMAATFKDPHTGRLNGKGGEYDDGNWPKLLRGNHRFDDQLDQPIPTSSKGRHGYHHKHHHHPYDKQELLAIREEREKRHEELRRYQESTPMMSNSQLEAEMNNALQLGFT